MVWNEPSPSPEPEPSPLQIISQNYVVWNSLSFNSFISALMLQIISQNYVVWNSAKARNADIRARCCKLYHKTTWFETLRWFASVKAHRVANYITKLRGLKQMAQLRITSLKISLQIISQNYVVWNTATSPVKFFGKFGCKLYHKTTWFETLRLWNSKSQLSKLQIISQNYVVWNNKINTDTGECVPSCKLYHKTTWFETSRWKFGFLERELLQIISQNYVVWNFALIAPVCAVGFKLQIISQNYVVWNRWIAPKRPQ